eukprot:scaffold99409_cov66-Phaeocystis_antarctica.AAC.3
MVGVYICPLFNTFIHRGEGVITIQPIFRFLVVIFDGDHDFEGLRSPRAHLDTVLRNRLSHPRHPRIVKRRDELSRRPAPAIARRDQPAGPARQSSLA